MLIQSLLNNKSSVGGGWGKMSQFLLMWISRQGKMRQNYNEDI